jgi:hypothetical protein
MKRILLLSISLPVLLLSGYFSIYVSDFGYSDNSQGFGVYSSSVFCDLEGDSIYQRDGIHQFHIEYEGATGPEWYWESPDSYRYKSLRLEWHNIESAGEGILDLETFQLKTEDESFELTEASLSELLFPASIREHPRALAQIAEVFSCILLAKEGTLPPPRHHTYSLADLDKKPEMELHGTIGHAGGASRLRFIYATWSIIWLGFSSCAVVLSKTRKNMEAERERVRIHILLKLSLIGGLLVLLSAGMIFVNYLYITQKNFDGDFGFFERRVDCTIRGGDFQGRVRFIGESERKWFWFKPKTSPYETLDIEWGTSEASVGNAGTLEFETLEFTWSAYSAPERQGKSLILTESAFAELLFPETCREGEEIPESVSEAYAQIIACEGGDLPPPRHQNYYSLRGDIDCSTPTRIQHNDYGFQFQYGYFIWLILWLGIVMCVVLRLQRLKKTLKVGGQDRDIEGNDIPVIFSHNE